MICEKPHIRFLPFGNHSPLALGGRSKQLDENRTDGPDARFRLSWMPAALCSPNFGHMKTASYKLLHSETR